MDGCALALILLLDSSGSLERADWARQVEGHARAFESAEVAQAIEREETVAVRADHFAYGMMPLLRWRVLRTQADAAAFARDLRAAGAMVAPVGATLTAAALDDAREAMATAPCEPERQVVDLVTDGPANDAARMPATRDALAEAGIRVNALFVATHVGTRESQAAGWEDGLEWLRAEVITPGGAALAAEGWGDFERAIRRKIVWEVSAR